MGPTIKLAFAAGVSSSRLSTSDPSTGSDEYSAKRKSRTSKTGVVAVRSFALDVVCLIENFLGDYTAK